MLFGFVRPFRISTPWFASKYDVEKDTTFARCAVMVTSSSAKSYFFVAGENRPPKGARRYCTLLMPSCFAIACESAYSKPDPFLIVVPVTRPFQKPGAGTSKPTVSVPACLVGGASGRAAAAAVTARTTRHAVARSRFTVPSLDRCAGKGECTASPGGGL